MNDGDRNRRKKMPPPRFPVRSGPAGACVESSEPVIGVTPLVRGTNGVTGGYWGQGPAEKYQPIWENMSGGGKRTRRFPQTNECGRLCQITEHKMGNKIVQQQSRSPSLSKEGGCPFIYEV